MGEIEGIQPYVGSLMVFFSPSMYVIRQQTDAFTVKYLDNGQTHLSLLECRGCDSESDRQESGRVPGEQEVTTEVPKA